MTEGVCIGKRRQSVPAGRESAGMSRIRQSSGRVRPVGNKEIMAAGLLYREGGRGACGRHKRGNGQRYRAEGEMSRRAQFRAQRKRANNDVCVRVFDIVVSSPGCERFVRLTLLATFVSYLAKILARLLGRQAT